MTPSQEAEHKRQRERRKREMQLAFSPGEKLWLIFWLGVLGLILLAFV